MIAATNDAASGINVGDMEAQIEASLKAQMGAGASKAEILQSMGQVESSAVELPTPVAAPSQSALIASVIAKAKAAAPVAAAPKAVVAAAKPAPVEAVAQKSEEQKASQEKVKEMASKLGIPFTNDISKLGSNSAISDALIEKAVALGKTEE
jgi:nucleoid-associated protein YgaU|tara:strand:+ start:37 stop:492 length:456 start_codon:yes stop_codon:yes gene_type:complete